MELSETLKNELELHLGSLMYEMQHCHDWFEKKRIQRHIEATEILLRINLKS